MEASNSASRDDALKPVLEAREIDVAYGPIRAVQRASVTVVDGSVTALVGANGAGKSSLLKAIVGLVPMRAKLLSVRGVDVAKMATLGRVRDLGIVLVPEGRGVFTGMTVDEGLEMGRRVGRYREKSGKVDTALDLDEIFDLFPNLRERRRQLGQQLSGGEQQMLAVAKALLMAPSILLVDEPSVGLAPKIIRGHLRHSRDCDEEVQGLHPSRRAGLQAGARRRRLRVRDRARPRRSPKDLQRW